MVKKGFVWSTFGGYLFNIWFRKLFAIKLSKTQKILKLASLIYPEIGK